MGLAFLLFLAGLEIDPEQLRGRVLRLTAIGIDLDALFASASAVAMIPIFLVALLAVRGIPALAYRSTIDRRHVIAAGVFQATSLPFHRRCDRHRA